MLNRTALQQRCILRYLRLDEPSCSRVTSLYLDGDFAALTDRE